MCGIAGFFTAQTLGDDAPKHLEGMLNLLEHRGPDGTGKHIEPRQGLAMGHTRLSIIDLCTGEQPIQSEDKRFTLTVNGEFYDFKRYRSLAMAEGERFASKSDSEIALYLYRKYGLDFFEHLRGEFAFAFYDRDNDEMLLARDRFGIRPLYFCLHQNTFYYASETKAFLGHPDVPVEMCPKAAVNQMMQTIVPGSSTFKDIHALEPGHFMVVKRRKGKLEISTRKYWDLDFPEGENGYAYADANEAIEAVREKLIESIIFRLEADVPVGCYLSGGIDSCCILGLASGAMQSPVKAFTIAFDHDDYDESSIAREMAESMRADQEVIHLKADDLYGENFIKTLWHTERSFYNTLGVAKLLMSRRVQECGYKTVITGEGSDELFGGYPAFKRDMFLHGLHHESPEVRKEYEAALNRSNALFKGAILSEQQMKHPAFETLCGFTPSWIQPWMETHQLAWELFNEDIQQELQGYDPVAAIAEKIDGEMLQNRHPLDKAQYTWSKCQLEGQILNWGGDRVDMANSMESRPAFLDHHLAEVAVNIPPKYRIHGNTEKWVLREAVKGVLPKVLYEREKFAFMAPPAHTCEAKLDKIDSLIQEFLNKDAIEGVGLFSPQAVDQFIQGYRQDTDPVSLTRKDTLLNHMLSLQIIHKLFASKGSTKH